jgi:hypothetical protein
MNDYSRSASAERLLETLLFEVGNCVLASVGYAEKAKENLDASHPAFSAVTIALQTAERAQAIVRQVGEEWLRRKKANNTDE